MQTAAVAKSNRPRRTVWTIIGVVAVLLIVGVLAATTILPRFRENQAAAQVQSGDIATAFIGDLSSSATSSGQVEPIQKSRLSANTAGLVKEVFVQAGSQVKEGDELVQLDTRDLVLQVERAKQNLALNEVNLEALLDGSRDEDIAAAKAAVHSAQVRLDNLLSGPDELEIAESEANIRAQQASLASASSSYNRTLGSISASAIASAEVDLIDAQTAYNQAKRTNESFPIASTHQALEDAAEKLAISQAVVDELLAGPNQGSLTSAASGVSTAAANLDQAQANHDALLVGPSADQIANAEANLAQAMANLDSLTAAASVEDIIIAEAKVEQARLALIDTEEMLDKAAIRAPFDGIVTAVFVTEGEYATGNVLEILSNDLKIILSVDEIDVGSLNPGQPAIITLETWPGEEIAGEIDSIAPSAGGNGSGVVTYEVQIILEETEIPVLVGMTANARLITSRIDDVLLVPNAAITANREAGTYTVNLVSGKVDGNPVTEQVEVIIGLKDSEYTHVVSGLSGGDEVVIGELALPTQRFGPGGNDGPFGFD